MISSNPVAQQATSKLRLFWFADLLASIALGVYLVAFNWLTVKNYGAFGVSIVTIGYAIPQTVLVLFGGVTSDFINKQTLYRICQILYVVEGLALYIACRYELPPLWFLTLISFLGGLTVAFSSPNKTSLISDLVPASRVTSTQEFFYFASGLGWVCGSLLASQLLSMNELFISNPHGSLAFRVYIVGMIPSIFLVPKTLSTRAKSLSSTTLVLRIENAITDIGKALNYLRETVDLMVLTRTLAIILVLGMPFTYLLSIYAHSHPTLHPSSKFFSHVYAALGVGNLLGAILGIVIAKSLLKQATLFVYFIFGLCISAIAALLLYQYWEILLTVLLAGLFTSLSTNLLKGLIQSQATDEMRGRIAGFTQLLAGFSSMSAGLAGFVIHHLSDHETKVYFAYESVQLVLLGLLAVLTLLSLPSIIKLRINPQ